MCRDWRRASKGKERKLLNRERGGSTAYYIRRWRHKGKVRGEEDQDSLGRGTFPPGRKYRVGSFHCVRRRRITGFRLSTNRKCTSPLARRSVLYGRHIPHVRQTSGGGQCFRKVQRTRHKAGASCPARKDRPRALLYSFLFRPPCHPLTAVVGTLLVCIKQSPRHHCSLFPCLENLPSLHLPSIELSYLPLAPAPSCVKKTGKSGRQLLAFFYARDRVGGLPAVRY